MGRKQSELAGMERKTVKEIDDAAEGYVDARDKRMKLTEKEKEAKTALISVMAKHGLSVYRDDSCSPALLVTLVPGEDNVKVSKSDNESATGGEEEAA